MGIILGLLLVFVALYFMYSRTTNSTPSTTHTSTAKQKKALLIIDVQNDFTPGGSLGVAEGDQVVSIINKIKHNIKWDLVVFSQDWHPKHHQSFSSEHVGEQDVNGNIIKAGTICVLPSGDVLWPDHCVQGSKGAKFHADLHVDKGDVIIQKGTDPLVDSYSAFADNNQKKLTDLYQILDDAKITDVFVCGLATDYCVNFSCDDAIHRKDRKGAIAYKTHLIVDASRGVDPTASVTIVEGLKKKGVVVVTSQDLLVTA